MKAIYGIHFSLSKETGVNKNERLRSFSMSCRNEKDAKELYDKIEQTVNNHRFNLEKKGD